MDRLVERLVAVAVLVLIVGFVGLGAAIFCRMELASQIPRNAGGDGSDGMTLGQDRILLAAAPSTAGTQSGVTGRRPRPQFGQNLRSRTDRSSSWEHDSGEELPVVGRGPLTPEQEEAMRDVIRTIQRASGDRP